MKSTEFRIGNIVFAEDEFLCMTSMVRLDTLGAKSCVWESITACNKGQRQEDNYIDLEPIPLTPDILQVCGFSTNDEINEWWTLPKSDFHIYNPVDVYYIVPYGNESSVQLKYLHQLQNLYFALTGEELSISL